MVTVWCGNYAFRRNDWFFKEVVKLGRDYADKEPGQRPSASSFLTELERLRAMSPGDGLVLLDQLEHRWRHPGCSPALYVLTCTLLAPENGFVLDTDGTKKEKLLCTKVGEAMRTVAPRIERYTWDKLGRLLPEQDSHDLRAVIYGDGDAMLAERQLHQVAEENGSKAMAVGPDGSHRQVGDETYVGVTVVGPICTFAREHANQNRD